MKIGPYEVSEETMFVDYLLDEDKPISIINTGAWRIIRPVHAERIAPCANACKANVKIRDCLAFLASGKAKEARELLLASNPIPAITGRICYHPCEQVCNRGQYDEGVAWRSIECFLGDWSSEESIHSGVNTPSKEKVAIVGSGPAGISAAYYLAKDGYRATIFEALPVAGGMLRVGIPEYRLPKAILDNEIEKIKQIGVEVHTGVTIGREITIDDLFRQGYRAVFVATGAHYSQKLGIPGEDSKGVIYGVSLLKKINLGQTVSIGSRVAVIGGGNVAIDAARTALRLGCKDVFILYRRSRAEIPAHEEEIKAAESEGIKINYLTVPVEIIALDGRVKALKCARVKLGKPDASGRKHPMMIDGSEFEIEVDTVVPAIGQAADFTFLGSISKSKADSSRIFKIDPITLSTNREGVFAGGDLQTGPATVVEAIAAGRRAAISIDRFIRNVSLVEPVEVENKGIVDFVDMNTTYFKKEPRVVVSDEATAISEANRCFYCGACNDCGMCWFFCPDGVINKKQSFEADLDWCKGCGLCSQECPRGVIVMEDENKWH